MKCVDIELLTKEIDNLYNRWCGSSTGLEVAEEGASIGTAESIFEEVHKIIDSLQQERHEVDLEKEVSKWWDASFPEPDFAFKKHRTHIVSNKEIMKLVSHIYELGLKRAAEMYDDIEYNRQRAEEE